MISLIAAMAKNRVIGRGGKIPWHLPADMRHFKEVTTGHPVIMGRKTYESIGRALPGRTNIVLSRNPEFAPVDAAVVPSFKEALKITEGAGEIFIIGGQSLYEQALPAAQKIYLTLVDAEAEGDAFFPELDKSEWRVAHSERHIKDEKNPLGYTYLIYERKNNFHGS
jgi:dihydrofolate reductase